MLLSYIITFERKQEPFTTSRWYDILETKYFVKRKVRMFEFKNGGYDVR